MQLLDPWFSDFLNMSFVGDNFEIDGRSEDFEPFFAVDHDDGLPIAVEGVPDGYSFQSLDTWEAPGIVLRNQDDQVIGFYHQFSSWVDPEHRGQGLGSLMILAYAEHYKNHAWEIEREQFNGGTAFSPGGYAVHLKAMHLAERKYGVVDLGRDDPAESGMSFV